MRTSVIVISIVVSAIIVMMIFFLRKIKTELCIHVSLATQMIEVRIKTFYGLVKINKKLSIKQLVDGQDRPEDSHHQNQEWMMTPELRQLLLQGLERMDIRQFVWKSVIGVGNAHHSAVAAGLLWSLKGALLALFASKWAIKSTNIVVHPDFQQYNFSTYMKCIIVMGAGNAMLTGYKMYKEVGKIVPVPDEIVDRRNDNG